MLVWTWIVYVSLSVFKHVYMLLLCQGSQGNEHALSRPAVTNGHGKLVALPQRVHSIIVNYVSHVSYLQDCHEFWDKADSIVQTNPSE